MNDQKQLIAIAEFCGWKVASKRFKLRRTSATGYRWEHETLPLHHGGGLYGHGYSDRQDIGFPRDYLNDLNAIHGAIARLDNEQTLWMDTWLYTTCSPNVDARSGTKLTLTWKATPAQLREALLRAIGIWEDGE